MKDIMNAELIVRTRQNVRDEAFIEMVAWMVPTAVPGSDHSIKYRLAPSVRCGLRIALR
jgi:hypothetical protein